MQYKTINFPLSPSSNAILLNGARTPLPQSSSWWANYQRILVVDGAWTDFSTSSAGGLLRANAPEKLTALGDGDSVLQPPEDFILTPDQNDTDFDKALQYAIAEGILHCDVFWGSGGEMDHFLGGLSVAAKYAASVELRFLDALQSYFFLTRNTTLTLNHAQGKTLSLYPFPTAEASSSGLTYELDRLPLDLLTQQSLRNAVNADQATIELHSGNAWVFISHLFSHLC